MNNNDEKVFLAQKHSDGMYDDLYHPEADDIVITYLDDDGETMLFKDGSMIKKEGLDQLAMRIVVPKKELEVSLREDGECGITILDNRYEEEIGSRSFNSALRRLHHDTETGGYVSTMDLDFNEEGFYASTELGDLYFEEIGMEKSDVMKASKAHEKKVKKQENKNIIGGFVDKMKSLLGGNEDENKQDVKNENKNKGSKNKLR